MKIALLNDTHFGCRNDSPAFIKYQNRFYDELFFPYLIENKIDTLIHLGDVVDRRKFINFNTAHNFQQKFWKRLWDLKIDTHIILGNHDTYYKNTNKVNSIQQLCTSFDGINEPWIYEGPKEIELGGCRMLFLPWICDDNYEDSIHAIDHSTADICFGHLEIKGFEMHKGHMNMHGLDKEQFKRFEKVMSGHFHKKSDDGHIFYLGTPYQIYWNDDKCPKGFHIFDTETRELERIINPHTIFKKVYYDDSNGQDYNFNQIKDLKDKYVKLIVVNKKDLYMFDKFVDKVLTESKAHDVKIIEDFSDLKAENVKNEIIENPETIATAIRIGNPASWDKANEAVTYSDGG